MVTKQYGYYNFSGWVSWLYALFSQQYVINYPFLAIR